MVASPWAIIKCRFADDDSDLLPDEVYERFFTNAGTGSFAIADFFRDMSHGRIDTGGSQIFGWFTVPVTRAELRDALLDNMEAARGWIYDSCVRIARESGAPLDGFAGIVVAMNRGFHLLGGDGVDMWGQAGGRVFCDRYSLRASLLGQEMAHGYGLNHSRSDRSLEADYRDPWDTMSTEVYPEKQGDHPEWGLDSIGPGLNAVNMMIAGWFDERRLWRCSEVGHRGSIRLRPLHRIDLPGPVAAACPDPYRRGEKIYFEFRTPRGWDSGIGSAVVLGHRRRGRHSYLLAPEGMTEGAVLDFGETGSARLRVEVVEIDEEQEWAELDIFYARPSLVDDLRAILGPLAVQILGAVPVDGGGAVIRPGGQIVPVGPWDPTRILLDHIADLQAASGLENLTARLSLQREALTRIIDSAQTQMETLQPYRSPAPPPRSSRGQNGRKRKDGCADNFP